MEKSGKHRYTLRDIQTGEIICADLTAGEVYRITGIPSQQVNKYWQRGTIRDCIWKVDLYEEGDEGIWTPELCMHWDCIRKMVLGGLKHGKGTYEEKIEVEKSCQQGSVAQNLAGRRSAPDICRKRSSRSRTGKRK